VVRSQGNPRWRPREREGGGPPTLPRAKRAPASVSGSRPPGRERRRDYRIFTHCARPPDASASAQRRERSAALWRTVEWCRPHLVNEVHFELLVLVGLLRLPCKLHRPHDDALLKDGAARVLQLSLLQLEHVLDRRMHAYAIVVRPRVDRPARRHRWARAGLDDEAAFEHPHSRIVGYVIRY